MSKLFKNSKQILALVMAFAVLAVSLFAGGIIVSAEEGEEVVKTPLCGGTTLFWDGTEDSKLADNGETGADWDHAIIIDDAKELNYLINKVEGKTAAGKLFYKMADGIDTIILQPESIATADADGNGVYDILELADGEETKAYFESITPTNWITRDNENWFAGGFDGNGVTIAGMYAIGCSSGLFPTADGGATFKNVAVTNSYIAGVLTSPHGKTNGQCRTGAIVGGTCGIGYGAKVAGVVSFDSIIVANNYVYGERSQSAAAVIMGANNSEETIAVNNAAVYGNKTGCKENTRPLCLINGFDGAAEINTITNAIVLGTSPYSTSYKETTAGLDCFENVITDASAEPWDDKADYTDTDLKSVADLTKFEIAKEYADMFSVFHGELELVQTSKVHYYACADCGFTYSVGAAAHEWNVDTCVICEYHCYHNEEGFYVEGEHRDATCTTKEAVVSYCNNCDWNDTVEVGPAPSGHQLEWVEEIPAGCYNSDVSAQGRKGFWHCTVCGGMFIEETEADAKMSENPVGKYLDSEEIPEVEELIIPLGKHNATNRENGSIQVYNNETGHWWICYTCEGRLNAVESRNLAEEGVVKKHKYEDAVCVDCGWECTEHNYEATGKLAVVGTCFVDEESEYKCTICGYKKSVVTAVAGHKVEKVAEVAATDKIEGIKEHYKCTVCKKVYLDAEGTKEATTAELIIAKTLPAGYENVVIGGGNMNTDTSNKSPSTGDNVASVLAVAALAGAVLVFARKK